MDKLVLVVVFIVFIIAIPLLIIWSLNTLFGLAIASTPATWFAALVLGSVVGSSSATKSRN